jgi:heme O synthase-like polyprenyltransferase
MNSWAHYKIDPSLAVTGRRPLPRGMVPGATALKARSKRREHKR